MITLEQYFLKHAHTDEHKASAENLLQRVNSLLEHAIVDGLLLTVNPLTDSFISGKLYGGFRPEGCIVGAKKSAHKLGKAVDIYDPDGLLDKYLTDGKLETYGLYREHPDATQGWCHLSTKPPASGVRTFRP